MLGVRRHVLNYAGFATLDLVYAVLIVRGARVDALCFVYCGRQIRLSGLLSEIRP